MLTASLQNPQRSLLWKSYLCWPLSPAQLPPQGTARKASTTGPAAAFTKTTLCVFSGINTCTLYKSWENKKSIKKKVKGTYN